MPNSIDNPTNKYQIPLSANSSQHPITAPNSFFCKSPVTSVAVVITCWSFHCVVFPKCVHSDHWPCTAPWAMLAHISDARSGRGQFSPRCPRLALTSAHRIQCTKQIPTRHKGQIFLCVHTFFRCTSLLNVIFMAQYCTCGVKGVTWYWSYWNNFPRVSQSVTLASRIYFNLLIIIIRIEHVFKWDHK